MPKTDEDLSFVVGFEPDMGRVDAALKRVGDDAGRSNKLAGFLGGLVGGQPGGSGRMGQIGGVIGGLLGGPVGSVIGGAIGDVAGNIGGKLMSKLGSPLKALGGVLDELSDPLGSVGLVLPDVLKGIVGTLTSFAAKASPATFLLFERAVEDTQAVIGRAFVPVLQSMRDGVQLFGDALASILPDATEVNNALAAFKEAFAEFGSSVRDAMGDVGPVFRTSLLVVIRSLGDTAAWAIRHLQPLVRWIGDFFRPLREVLGLAHEERGQTGAAARSANISGIGEYQRRLQIAAFAGPGATMSSVPSSVDAINKAVNNIYEWLSTLSWADIGRALADGIASVGAASRDGLASAVSTAVGGGTAGNVAGATVTGSVFGATPEIIRWLFGSRNER